MPRRSFFFLRFTVLALFLFLLRLTYNNFYSPASTPLARSLSPSPKMSSSGPLRLAILEADIPQPGTVARVGNYTAVFTDLFRRACAASEPPKTLTDELTISGHDIVNDLDAYPSLDDIDAVLISGSKYNSFDNDPWILKLVEFTQATLATKRVRIIGVCFGHQILGRALGAHVCRNDKGWEVSVEDFELTPEGKKVFGLEKMRIHQMHTDIVADFPADAVPLGGNDICKVQAMYSPGRYIAVQGHPEFTNEIVTEVVTVRNKIGLFSDDLAKDALSRVANEHDGVSIAQTFLKFLRD